MQSDGLIGGSQPLFSCIFYLNYDIIFTFFYKRLSEGFWALCELFWDEKKFILMCAEQISEVSYFAKFGSSKSFAFFKYVFHSKTDLSSLSGTQRFKSLRPKANNCRQDEARLSFSNLKPPGAICTVTILGHINQFTIFLFFLWGVNDKEIQSECLPLKQILKRSHSDLRRREWHGNKEQMRAVMLMLVRIKKYCYSEFFA